MCSAEGNGSLACPGTCIPYLEIGDRCPDYAPCARGSDCYDSHCEADAVYKHPLGEDCEPGVVGCAKGLVCMPADDAGYVCAAPRSLGEACSDDADCAFGGCVREACTLRAEGQPCLTDASCRDDLVCNVEGRCGAPAGPREACQRMTQCQEDLICVGGDFGGPGRCVAMGVGSTCCWPGGGVSHCGPSCQTGLVCEAGGHCRAPGRAGDACDVGENNNVVTCLRDLVCSADGICEPRELRADGCAFH